MCCSLVSSSAARVHFEHSTTKIKWKKKIPKWIFSSAVCHDRIGKYQLNGISITHDTSWLDDDATTHKTKQQFKYFGWISWRTFFRRLVSIRSMRMFGKFVIVVRKHKKSNTKTNERWIGKLRKVATAVTEHFGWFDVEKIAIQICSLPTLKKHQRNLYFVGVLQYPPQCK